jgi:hypothetical protein
MNPQQGPHYYLATRAHLRATELYLERLAGQGQAGLESEELWGYAKAQFHGKRAATAEARIAPANGGADVYALDVTYSVLTPRMFERFFAAHRIDNVEFDPLAYRRSVHFEDFVEDLYLDGEALLLSARFGFQPGRCAGHFPRIPALPVAILMFILSKAAGKLLEAVTGIEGVRYSVAEARINAENLAFPDQKLHLVARYAGDTGNRRHQFECNALAEGTSQRKFGEMQLTLQVHG